MDQLLSSDKFEAHRNSLFLNELTLLNGMNISHINDFDKVVCRTFSARKGDFLFQEGDECKSLYVLRSGSVKTIKQNISGVMQVIGFHLAGEFIGFDGFATGNYDCAVQFLETSSISEFPLDKLDAQCSSNPGIHHKILSSMSLEISRNHELLFLLGKMSAEEKLAAFLLNFSSRMKQRHWKELEFNMSMARCDIASYLGLAVETISRLFAQFREKGLIDIDKRHVKILDRESLKRIIYESGQDVKHNKIYDYCAASGKSA